MPLGMCAMVGVGDVSDWRDRLSRGTPSCTGKRHVQVHRGGNGGHAGSVQGRGGGHRQEEESEGEEAPVTCSTNILAMYDDDDDDDDDDLITDYHGVLTIGSLRCVQWLQAYIHPILPVLDVTRPIVTAFNARYQRAMADVKSKLHTCLHGSHSYSSSHLTDIFHAVCIIFADCTWLDFYPDMLSDDCQSLRDEWKLDGTHVSPTYVRLIENSLNEV
jgi:hypothetical protein